jgi:hypothetical protein
MLDRRRFAALSSAWALAPTLARAQAPAYPSRFVRLIVPFPPGGGTDAIARVVSAKLSALWGQQMVVENKGGGARPRSAPTPSPSPTRTATPCCCSRCHSRSTNFYSPPCRSIRWPISRRSR